MKVDELKVGDTVTVRSDLYLGQWVVAGGQGRIVRIGDNDGQSIYHVDIKGIQYSFVRDELMIKQCELQCPFCGEAGFDKPGLKSHLEHGDCEEYNATDSLQRVF